MAGGLDKFQRDAHEALKREFEPPRASTPRRGRSPQEREERRQLIARMAAG